MSKNHESNGVDIYDSEQIQNSDLRVSTTSKIATQPIIDHVDRVMESMDTIAEDHLFGEPTLITQAEIDDIAKNIATIEHVPKINRLGAVFSEALTGNDAFAEKDGISDIEVMYSKILAGKSRKGINQGVKNSAKNKSRSAEILEVFEVLGDENISIHQNADLTELDDIIKNITKIENGATNIIDTVDDSDLDREFKNLFEQLDSSADIGQLKLLAFKNIMDVCSNPLAISCYKGFLNHPKSSNKRISKNEDNFNVFGSSDNIFFDSNQNFGFLMANYFTESLDSFMDGSIKDQIPHSVLVGKAASAFEHVLVNDFLRALPGTSFMRKSQEEKDFKNELTDAVKLMSKILVIDQHLSIIKHLKEITGNILNSAMIKKHSSAYNEAFNLLNLAITTTHDEKLSEIISQETDEEQKFLELQELAAIEKTLIQKASDFRDFIMSRDYYISAEEMNLLNELIENDLVSQQFAAVIKKKEDIKNRHEQLQREQEQREAKAKRAARLAILREQSSSLFDEYSQIDKKYDVSVAELRNREPEIDDLSDAFYSALYVKKRNQRDTAVSMERRRKVRNLLIVILGSKAENTPISDHASQVFQDSLKLKSLNEQIDIASENSLVPAKETLLPQLHYLDKLIEKGNAERVIEQALNGNDLLIPIAEFIADYTNHKQ
ncbi:hypothetical protein EBZ57_02300 [bacterium]|nr:hypothetical protein [bacterium]